jgi:flagellar biosynthesis/type III secretory pathway protein FliH
VDDAFVPLAVWLCGEPEREPALGDAAAPIERRVARERRADAAEALATDDDDVALAIADARRFRATLADAIDAAVVRVVQAVAADVLARELLLAPAAIATIVREAVVAAAPVLRVRVHPREAATLRLDGVAVDADATLRPGDAALDVRDGTYDLSLGARLAAILAAWAA